MVCMWKGTSNKDNLAKYNWYLIRNVAFVTKMKLFITFFILCHFACLVWRIDHVSSPHLTLWICSGIGWMRSVNKLRPIISRWEYVPWYELYGIFRMMLFSRQKFPFFCSLFSRPSSGSIRGFIFPTMETRESLDYGYNRFGDGHLRYVQQVCMARGLVGY